jgi:hypothetical protein
MPQDLVVPLDTVIVQDQGLIIEEFEIGANAVPADMLPGTWVIYDTVAGDVKQGSDEVHGVIGLLMEKPTGKLTDAYAVGDQCRVITGGRGLVLSRIIINGGAINPGTPIVCAALGLARAQTVGAQGAQGEVIAIGATVAANDAAAETNAIVKIHKGVMSKATA